MKHKIAGIGKEYKEGGFKEAYYCLPHNKLIEAREEICALCFWSKGIFGQKLSGKISFRIYEIEKIEEYFRAKNLDAWTGEKI